MRTFTKSTVVVGSLLASMLAFSCASDRASQEGSSVGSVGLAISLPNSASEINTVRFTISGNGYGALGAASNRSDNVDVSRSHTASAQLGGIPAADNYTLTLSATSTTGISCSGQTTFNVTAGRVSRAQLQLSCQLPDGQIVHPPVSNGSVNVRADVVEIPGQAGDNCPLINSVSMMPSEVALNETITLVANATDADNQALTYTWTQLNGSQFGTRTAGADGRLAYTCSTAGDIVLRLTVSDGVPACDAVFEGVTQTEQVIRCLEPAINPAQGGAAGASSGAAGSSAAVAGASGAAAGGAAAGGAAAGGSSAVATAPASPLPAIVAYWGSASCAACAADNCSSVESTVSAAVYTNEGCDALATQAERDRCYAVVTCEMRTDCTNVAGAANDVCYCGTSSNCIGGVGINGVCRAEIEAGFGTTDSAIIAANFGSIAYPGGRGNALIQCLVNGINYGGPDYTGDAHCSACFSATPAQ